jgi:hypothetical protein
MFDDGTMNMKKKLTDAEMSELGDALMAGLRAQEERRARLNAELSACFEGLDEQLARIKSDERAHSLAGARRRER